MSLHGSHGVQWSGSASTHQVSSKSETFSDKTGIQIPQAIAGGNPPSVRAQTYLSELVTVFGFQVSLDICHELLQAP